MLLLYNRLLPGACRGLGRFAHRFYFAYALIFAFSILALYGFYLETLYDQYKLPAIDFGVFVTAMRDYGYFQAPKAELYGDWIGDWRYAHFSIAPMLSAPLGYVFQGKALLIVSWLAIAIGAIGVWKFALVRLESETLSTFPPLAFLCFFSIPFTLSTGYQDNLPGIAAIPWLFWAWEKALSGSRSKKSVNLAWLRVFCLALFITLCKEHLTLLVAALGVTLSIPADYSLSRIHKTRIWMGLCVFLGGIGMYFLITKLVIPYYAPASHKAEGYLQVKMAYSSIIKDVGAHGGFLGFLRDLWTVADLRNAYLFGDPFHGSGAAPAFAHAKPELWNCLWMGIGASLFFLPRWWPPFALVLAWKLSADDPVRWGVGHQYALELAPLAALAFVDLLFLQEKSRFFLPRMLAPFTGGALLLLTFQTTQQITNHRLSPWSDGSQEALLDEGFWNPNHSYAGVKEMLKLVPKDAAVCATTRLVPQLAWRDTVREFPTSQGCELIALDLLDPQPYPFSDTSSRRKLVNALASSSEWRVVYKKEGALLLKRRDVERGKFAIANSSSKQKGQ